MPSDSFPVAIVTGASSGLGLHIADALLRQGYRVVMVARDADRLASARDRLVSSDANNVSDLPDRLALHRTDVADAADVDVLMKFVDQRFGRLDVLVNTVGESDRGLIENLSTQRLESLIQQNVVTALLCSQAAIERLEKTGGVIVNIGSLASKVGARYIGGYAIAKHALAGMTSQLRLELRDRGIHVALVNPGPIRRDDAGSRYADRVDGSMPDQAARPGGGTRIKGLAPERVAADVVRCIRRRTPDVVIPGYLRVLIAVGHALPRLGDWMLVQFTSSKKG